MAAHPGYTADNFLVTYEAGITPGAGAYTPADVVYAAERVEFESGDTLALFAPIAGESTSNQPIGGGGTDHGGQEVEAIGGLWWERIHVLPRRIDLGFIVSTQVVEIDIFNADRFASHTWNNWINNAGAGVSILSIPSFPDTFISLEGKLFDLQVTPDGPSSVDTTLDYVFDLNTVLQPITFTRIVAFPFQPERPIDEYLEWLTDVIEKQNGTEQRIAIRKNPRQIFEVTIKGTDGTQRQRIDYLLFDWQSRLFGFPVWFEPSLVTVAVAPNDTSATVQSTDYADLRVGGACMLWSSDSNYEVLTITAVNPTSVEFESPVTGTFPVKSRLLPVRFAFMESAISSEKMPYGLEGWRMRLRVLDNDADLADTSAFSTFNSKVLLDGPNAIENSLNQALVRRIRVVDGLAGIFTQSSPWDVSRPSRTKRFVTRTRQAIWEVRQLLHALRGRQVSYYLPTFYSELTPTQAPVSGSANFIISNVGYSDFVRSRQPKNVLRLVKTDGTVLIHTITDASELSATEEQLTVSPVWPSNIPLADIRQVQLIEKVRTDSDRVRLTHTSALGDAVVEFPVKAVLE